MQLHQNTLSTVDTGNNSINMASSKYIVYAGAAVTVLKAVGMKWIGTA